LREKRRRNNWKERKKKRKKLQIAVKWLMNIIKRLRKNN
jgi:hypothetical protein